MVRRVIVRLGTLAAIFAMLPITSATAASLTWMAPMHVTGAAQFQAISCPSVALCVAVDSGGNIVTSTNPASPTSSWKVTHVGSDSFSGISCWSDTQCVAVDRGGHAWLSANPTGAASAWSSSNIDAHGLNGVSCPTEFLCVAIDNAGNVLTTDNGIWPPARWNSTSVGVSDGVYALRAVSCSGPTLCVIAADFGYELTSTNPLLGSWTANFVEAPYPSNWALDGVSCVAPSLCVADDNGGNVLTSNPTTTTSAWGLSAVDNGNWIDGLSCGAPTLCAAGDSDGDVLTSNDPTGGQGAWSVDDVDGFNIVFAISCVSTTLCVAADFSGNVIVGRAIPVNLSAPSITGSPAEGQTLTEQHAIWTNGPSGYAYQWWRCDAAGAHCAPIPGAVNQTYTLAPADVGFTVMVSELATNTIGAASAASRAVGPAVSSIPGNVALPTIFGAVMEGEPLGVQRGAWSNNPTAFSYQWLRCNASGISCQPIEGQTGVRYSLSATDIGSTVRVTETASNAFGLSDAETAAVGPVTDGAVNVHAFAEVASARSVLRTPVALLSDPADPSPPKGGYAVRVAWGDGASSAGWLVPRGPGSYTVMGSHIYRQAGTFTILVSVRAALGAADADANRVSVLSSCKASGRNRNCLNQIQLPNRCVIPPAKLQVSIPAARAIRSVVWWIDGGRRRYPGQGRTFKAALPTAGLRNGKHTLTARFQLASGNPTTLTRSRSFAVCL